MKQTVYVYPMLDKESKIDFKTLNSSFSYLEEQDRLTRANILGHGVIHGLTFDVEENQGKIKITLHEGAAINDDGCLIQINERIEYVKMEEQNGKYDLHISSPIDYYAYDVIFPLDKLFDYVIGIDLVKFRKTNDPNEQVIFRPFLIEKTKLKEKRRRADRLMPVRIQAFLGLKGISDMTSFKEKIKKIGSNNLKIVEEYVKKSFVANGIIDDLLGQKETTGKISQQCEKMKQIMDGDPPCYAILFLNDIKDAINEFGSFYNDFIVKYERHISFVSNGSSVILGLVSGGGEDNDPYRDIFTSIRHTPQYDVDKKILTQLYKRIFILFDAFKPEINILDIAVDAADNGTVTPNAPENVKLIPSRGNDALLGERSMPFYYETGKVEGCWAAHKPDAHAFNVFAYDRFDDHTDWQVSSPNGFYRIEGHYGYTTASVQAKLNGLIEEYNLPLKVECIEIIDDLKLVNAGHLKKWMEDNRRFLVSPSLRKSIMEKTQPQKDTDRLLMMAAANYYCVPAGEEYLGGVCQGGTIVLLSFDQRVACEFYLPPYDFNITRDKKITISYFEPIEAGFDEVLVITGSGFSSTPGENIVTLNGIVATVVTAIPTELRIKVPKCRDCSGFLCVTVNGETVIPSPKFTYLLTATEVSTFAGDGTAGYLDGKGMATRFNGPTGITFFKGDFYVCDRTNHCIRKITLAGEVTTYAGSVIAGYQDGVKEQAQFEAPISSIMTTDGELYVVDQNNTIRKVTSMNIDTFAGSKIAGHIDAKGKDAQFDNPCSITIDESGNFFIVEHSTHCIRRISSIGEVFTIAGDGSYQPGYLDAIGRAAKFNYPVGITWGAKGVLFVADQSNHCIRKITLSTGLVETVAGSGKAGYKNGKATEAQFNRPINVAIDKNNYLYVTDTDNSCIRRISPSGQVTWVAGVIGGGDMLDGVANEATFKAPREIIIGPDDNLYVADHGNHCIRIIKME